MAAHGESPPQTKAEQVATAIRTRIHQQGLVAGDRLPTEKQWAEQLGVSRLIVREAIGRLRGLGVVESKPRTGLRVAAASPFNSLEYHLPQMAANDTTRRELEQLRLLFELGNAWKLAETISPDQVAVLQGIVNRIACCSDRAEARGLHCDFHLAMLNFLGNSLINELGRLIVPLSVQQRPSGDDWPPWEVAAFVQRHQQIVDALAEHHAPQAVRLLEKDIQASGPPGEAQAR